MVVVTFDPHPIAVLRPELAPPALTTIATRAALLERARAPTPCWSSPSTGEVAAWSPERFVTEVLVDALHARAVVVGANFRFGARAAGDVATLLALGAAARPHRRGRSPSTVVRRSGPRPTSATA